ncbi:MAG: DUF2971 domain-containing protein [Deltaproteobacteria bacterium]|nr:DUF2971 domain-containing protein [Deltaproteobacteria bacterium]
MQEELYAKNQGKTHFCKYVTADTTKIILTDLKGKWSSPYLFNDPFDMQTEMRHDFDFDDLEKPLLQEMARLIYHDKTVPVQEDSLGGAIIQLMRMMSQKIPEKIYIEELKGSMASSRSAYQKNMEEMNEWFQNYAKIARVFCVVEKHDDLLMWAHYAKDHTGAVIKFKLLPEEDTPLCAAYPITYIDDENKLPTIASMERWIQSLTGENPLDTKTEVFEKYCFTKSKHWDYEGEWRVLGQTRNPEQEELFDLWPFLPEEFDTIYLGCKMEDSDRDNILRCLTGSLSHVQVYEAKKSKTKYELDFARIR